MSKYTAPGADISKELFKAASFQICIFQETENFWLIGQCAQVTLRFLLEQETGIHTYNRFTMVGIWGAF